MADQRVGGIAWTDETWNPIRGCSRVSEGCRHCYAELIAGRFANFDSYEGLAHKVGREWRWTGEVRFVEEALDHPLRWKRPRRIFVNSMSDLFHEKVKDEWIDRIYAVMALTQRHIYQVLTKRPERMRAYLSDARHQRRVVNWMDRILGPKSFIGENGTDNGSLDFPCPAIWLGVSVEDQATADERIPLLLQTPAAVRFVSYEPALAGIDLSRYLKGARHESGGDGVLGARGFGHVHGGCSRTDLASQGMDAGQPKRVGPGADSSRDEEARGCQSLWPTGEPGELSAGDVRRQGAALERPCSPRGLDDDERRAHPGRSGNQPQGRRRREQPAAESGGRDGGTEYDARDQGAWGEAQGAPRLGEPVRQDQRGHGGGDQEVGHHKDDASVEDRQALLRQPADRLEHPERSDLEARGLDWVIIGGESGPSARPFDLAWARSAIAQCRAADVAAFCKQLGSFPIWDGCGLVANNPPGSTEKVTVGEHEMHRLRLRDRKGGDIQEFPEDLRVREFPR